MKSNLKLLVVDDEIKIIGGVVKHALKNHTYQERNFDVIGAATSQEAHDLLEKETFDFALVDLVLDEHEGLQGGMNVVRYITENYSIPTMVLSSSDEQRDAIDSMRAGARDYINKKYIRSDLTSRINVVLDKYNNEKANEIALQEAHTKLVRFADILSESEEKYRTLVELLPHIIYRIDADGYFTFVNSAVKALGYDPEELKGEHFSKIVHPEDVERVSRKFVLPRYKGKITGRKGAPKLFDERRSGKRITKNLEVRIVAKPGEVKKETSEFMVGSVRSSGELTAIGVYDQPANSVNKKFLGTVGVIFDISKRKQIEEELQKAQKLESLGVLAGGIAHDFNNLLAGLFGYIDMARTYGKPNPKVSRYLEKALLSYERAKDLTLQLLTFAKGASPVKKVVNIRTLFEESSQLTLSGSNITCTLNLADDLDCVEADGEQIGHVINNLLINARQAMSDGGSITVTGVNRELESHQVHDLPAGKYIEIVIEDQGSGISRKILSKIFDPFFTTKQQGSGLGLATSYSIISKHGGHIIVDSKKGAGTCFTIFLPATDKEEIKSSNESVEVTVQASGRILLMDDEDSVREMASDLLETMGYDVAHAKNGEEALYLYNKSLKTDRTFDLVILDLTVKGGMGGDKAIEKLLEMDPDVKAVVSSGYAANEAMAKPEDYGFIGVIPKPYKIEELSMMLEKILSK